MLLGLLSYKPQIWLLVPLAVLAARQWRAFAWMIGTVLVLSAVSLGLFSTDLWRAFFHAAQEAGSSQVTEHMYQLMYMQTTTLLAAARMLGFPAGLAGIVQFAGAALPIGAVWFAFRRDGASEARRAGLATATFFVSPDTLNSDVVLMVPAAAA